MAHKITVHGWGESGFETNDSEDEYEVYEVAAIKKGDTTWDHDEGVAVNFYTSMTTGVTTTDVKLYEESRTHA